jgi:hypothetical protein
MPPFGFGKKGQPQTFTTDITDKEDLEEINEIAEMLNPNEKVFIVARQSRLKPGSSAFTPKIVFGTDRRIITKDPSFYCHDTASYLTLKCTGGRVLITRMYRVNAFSSV